MKPGIPQTGNTIRFRRFENLGDSLIPLDSYADPGVGPVPFESEYAGIWRRRTEIATLRDAQYEFNKIKYNQLNKEKQMFNQDELKFIKETAEKDLVLVKQRCESTANEMARLGKNLSDIKITESRLTNILQAIVDHEKESRPREDQGPFLNVGSYYNRAGCC